MSLDPELIRHKEWLGFLQPVGLVVSPPALVKAQAVVNRNVVELQQTLKAVVGWEAAEGESAVISDFPAFAVEVRGWQLEDLVEALELPSTLEVPLKEYGEILKPTYAVPNSDADGWLMLVQVIPSGTLFDEIDPELEKSGKWNASPQAKFERLLRETQIPIGLLCNGADLRLIYAPRGESSGYVTFPIAATCEVSGRLILGAMEMLLGVDRLFNLPSDRRLPKLLEESRKYQSEVSTKLSEQVLEALWQLLRGFQTANELGGGNFIGEIAESNPQHIYGGLIAVLLRLVFLLYAEDEGLMPQDAVYQGNYSVTGLYEKLRENAGNYPDTMDRRYGAWAWLLSLFRLVYDGGGHGNLYLPARHGQLFDPDEYPFLEGRREAEAYLEIPRMSDGVIFRVLQGLLVLDGERLSYRSLDVEQIGSVYEAVMGFAVEKAPGKAIALRPKDVVVNVEALLAAKPGDRAKLLKDWADCTVSGSALSTLKTAKTVEDILSAIGRKISPRTPQIMPPGSLYLQPGEERRRSGSHYTPRSLTEPIVRKTLKPVLEALGENPTPEQILSLKVCDPAMGSGAFLVEACRQLAEELVKVWERGEIQPEIPPGEEALLYSRRLVAQRCLYGVDKNPFAANLAKLSLWLITLAKDYPFTFIDHALKCGDSLVGLTRGEIGTFIREGDIYETPLLSLLKDNVDRAKAYRDEIGQLGETEDDEKRDRFYKAEEELREARLTGNVAVAAFFAAEKDKQRKELRLEFSQKVRESRSRGIDFSNLEEMTDKLQRGDKPIPPFHWEIEFPEVFDRLNPGFDAIVGNPPFIGGSKISSNFGNEYLEWLKVVHPESHGNADLVAHFFRRAFTILRQSGCFGLIATNTIAQGDTRSTGLRYICQNGGTIYHAQKRLKWPGLAAVVVSIVHLQKVGGVATKLGKVAKNDTELAVQFTINDRLVPKITAFLFHAGGNEDPATLIANANKSFLGSKIYGQGFTFDDSDADATPISEMHRLIEKNPKNADSIFPYIGGEEVNSSPTHSHNRYVINFGEMSESEAWEYPDLMKIVEEKVKPQRMVLRNTADGIRLKTTWWQFGRTRPEMQQAIAPCDRVLVCSQTSKYRMFTFLIKNYVFDQKIVVFALDNFSEFTILHSRVHEIWAIFLGSTMKDDPVYTPTDCFQTFPFPENWETNPQLEEIGKTYYEFRAALMVRNNQGLTDTYNRFHDPDERDADLLKLRQLHAEMDLAVLNAYGWTDISLACEFLLDYEEEEEENSSGRQKKKPWRYRWNEEIHDEVLARLLVLNQQRHQQEILGGQTAEKKGKTKAGKKTSTQSRKKTSNEATIPNFPAL